MTLTDKKIKAAIEAKGGNLTKAAEALGVSRTAMYNRINASEELQNALEDAREAMVDLAEAVLITQLNKNNLTAAAIVLNNSPSAKKRGWGPRHEVSGTDGGAVRIVLERPGRDEGE